MSFFYYQYISGYKIPLKKFYSMKREILPMNMNTYII